MNKKMKHILSLAAVLLAIWLNACDVIEPPYEKNYVPPQDTGTYIRNILLEEYTGFRCGNCPRAAELAASLHEFYGDRIVVMRVHAGGYAIPKGTKYTYDFRNPDGNIYDTFFGNSKAGNPNGLISRYGYPGNHIYSESKWDGVIQQLIATKPMMTIELEAEGDETTREIVINYKIKYLENGKPNHNICLLVLEDSIIAYQTDYRLTPQDIPDYVHMHILRGAVNGTWGEPLNEAGIAVDDTFEKQIQYKIPEGKDWKMKDLSILAYVHDNGATYEVYQVQLAHVKLK